MGKERKNYIQYLAYRLLSNLIECEPNLYMLLYFSTLFFLLMASLPQTSTLSPSSQLQLWAQNTFTYLMRKVPKPLNQYLGASLLLQVRQQDYVSCNLSGLRRMKKYIYCISCIVLLEYKNEVKDSDKFLAPKQKILAEIHSHRGCEWYTMKLLGKWYKRQATYFRGCSVSSVVRILLFS